ncbi:MAG: hypothetical protein PCFJNLEI_02306 [Verrucomicrobiae bacterium]|nr:hypothetical protein [Verrucomicrobiae bacterium]
MDIRVKRFERRDWVVAAVFFIVAIGLYQSTRTRQPYLWDSVEFALGVTDYNVEVSQPHAPGYFLYVMLGRLVNEFVGGPHTSLAWMSVVGGAGLVGVMYLLGTAMWGRVTGMVAGVLTLTSPMVWFYSSVALTYVVDAVLVVSLVLFCWRAREREVPWGWVVLIGAWLGLMGGIRQQSVPGMAVLVGVTLGQARDCRWAKIGTAVAVCGAVTAGWVGWMLAEIGGWEVYWKPLESIGRFHAHKTLLGGGVGAVGWNMFFAGLYSFNGVLLGSLAVVCQLREHWGESERFLVWWGLPVFLLATMVGYTEAPGHVFTYLPALVLFAASFVGRRWGRMAILGLVAMVVGNIFVFWAWPAKWDGILWGTLRTARELREHDQQLCKAASRIREQFRPGETILCHWYGDLLFGIRHFQACLPEYENLRLDPDLAMVKPPGRDFMFTSNGRTEFVRSVDFRRYRQVVVVVPTHLSAMESAKFGSLEEVSEKIALGKIDLYVMSGSAEFLRGWSAYDTSASE